MIYKLPAPQVSCQMPKHGRVLVKMHITQEDVGAFSRKTCKGLKSPNWVESNSQYQSNAGMLFFPGNMFISRTAGNIGKYPEICEIPGNTKFQIMDFLVGPVVGVLSCWKLIKVGTKTHYRSK